MLAYYVQWHMTQRLRPLFEADGEGKNRRWTFKGIIERLKEIRKNRVELEGVEFDRLTEPDAEQEEIIRLLKTKPE
jgi:hypothetical protein